MSVTVNNVTAYLEGKAPLSFQESYDNAGLTTGNPEWTVSGILITLDITEEIIDEAIRHNCNLIISHHPLVFSPLKKLTGSTWVERTLLKAIKNDIALYAAHTNLDSMLQNGVNTKICEKLGLRDTQILDPVRGNLRKLVTFVPTAHAENVRLAIFEAGAGHIGNYDQCSYNLDGKGSFRGSEDTNPFAGEKGTLHFEEETRIETVFPAHLQAGILRSLLKAHPYEEVAYDIYPLENTYPLAGMGMTGSLVDPVDENQLLLKLKDIFEVSVIRHTKLLNKKIKKVAVCGGSGSFLLKKAMAAGADIFITGDMKYHQFFDHENKIIIADIGHYESEQFTREIFYDILTKKFANFAVRLSDINTNPIKYL